MGDLLKKQPRDILFSLCQYGDVQRLGMGRVSRRQFLAHDRRHQDTWSSLARHRFQPGQDTRRTPGPGIGTIPTCSSWARSAGANLHPTRLTPNEQYTHISLWCLLSSPLLIGCDMTQLDAFTLNLLENDEVIAIDQDVLGKQAMTIAREGTTRVYAKKLADGSEAVGLFNLGENGNPCHREVVRLRRERKIKGPRFVAAKRFGQIQGRFHAPPCRGMGWC